MYLNWRAHGQAGRQTGRHTPGQADQTVLMLYSASLVRLSLFIAHNSRLVFPAYRVSQILRSCLRTHFDYRIDRLPPELTDCIFISQVVAQFK